MTNKLFLVLFLFCWCMLIGCGNVEETTLNISSQSSVSQSVPHRVVVLSPALTEILYALELENCLVGVTNHCKYPPDAQSKPVVGTIFSPNLEKIGALRPDRVLLNAQYPELASSFQRFGWKVEQFPDQTIEDVFETIRQIGRLFQVEKRAEVLASSLEKRLATLREKTKKCSQLRVLVVVSRNYKAETLEEVYIVGHDHLCTPLLEASGGRNAYQGNSPFPKVTPEGVLHLAPDVILEVLPDDVATECTTETLERAWKTLSTVPAVRDGKILRITESEAALIPGPSMISWAEKTAILLDSVRK